MKILGILTLLISLLFLAGCQTTRIQKEIDPQKIIVAGPIEITKYSVTNDESEGCSISGTLVYEFGDDVVERALVKLKEVSIDALSDFDGKFNLENISAGSYTLEIHEDDINVCIININLNAGDHVTFDAIVAKYADIKDLKPIIYIYPEEKTEVEIELIYDGEITTTYPKYPKGGWKVTASPDGTLIDENNKEYYALYWEGKPNQPLGIQDGFVVSKDGTIAFLEEKLALLGLNSKESNEFIIFWLPILEKNKFNLIHFSGSDYLERAELKISPTPQTVIRIAMVFKGLDEEFDFPVQDLTPLTRTRNGFTVVEWGGQELPKEYSLGI
jgi:hypothetical protein